MGVFAIFVKQTEPYSRTDPIYRGRKKNKKTKIENSTKI
jgi:hypothetical protein